MDQNILSHFYHKKLILSHKAYKKYWDNTLKKVQKGALLQNLIKQWHITIPKDTSLHTFLEWLTKIMITSQKHKSEIIEHPYFSFWVLIEILRYIYDKFRNTHNSQRPPKHYLCQTIKSYIRKVKSLYFSCDRLTI